MSNLKKCANCGTTAVKMDRCSLCKEKYYCDKNCQQRDWKDRHKMYCFGYDKSNYGLIYDKLIEIVKKMEFTDNEMHILLDPSALFFYTIDETKFKSMDLSDFGFGEKGAISRKTMQELDEKCKGCIHADGTRCLFDEWRKHFNTCEWKSQTVCINIQFFVDGTSTCYFVHLPRTLEIV